MRAWLALALALPLVVCAQVRDAGGDYRDAGRGGEEQVSLPQFPKPDDYLPLQVSTTTPFVFFVDAKSVRIGKDGVVRYSLIAKSSGGAVNISFEGINCSKGEFRVYAFGRPDNTWSESRYSRWQPIPADARNAQRAVLYRDIFCFGGVISSSAEEAVESLRKGARPGSSYLGF